MIYTLVLAAGASTRLAGNPKALLTTLTGKTFLQQIAETARAAGSGGVTIVIGTPHGDQIKKRLPVGVGSTVNPMPDRGMLSSIETGLQAIPANAQGVLIWPVDIPLVDVTTVKAILNAAPGKIIVPTEGGKAGNPVRLPRKVFAELASLDGSLELRALFDKLPDLVERLAVDDAHIHQDINTQAEYDSMRMTPLPPKKKK